MKKPTMWFLNRSDTNQFVQSKKMARSLKFCIKKIEELYYPCSENKGPDQLRSVSLLSHMQNVGFLMIWLIYLSGETTFFYSHMPTS